ncbi:MAG: hypothetical protein HKL92_06070 [Candidatus Eremiobacteraeota bacterium]|nr:hypothetical protein [Candidatus Eremiobacteraeota bacterium]NNM92893.1 hypothetical protein [Candidatus Eremiobacteraeota bacterium]
MFASIARPSIGAFFLAAILAPGLASAATVSASLVPDGTYIVRVEAVKDAQHAIVMLANGMETTLTATGSASFAKVKPNQQLRVSIIAGKTPVLAVNRR